MKGKIKVILAILPIVILISCNSKNDNDPNGPKVSAIKMLNDECQQKSGGIIKVTGIFSFTPYTGNINGLDYYYINSCNVDLEVIRDSSYANCFIPKGNRPMIMDFNFTNSSHPSQKIYNNLNTGVLGIDSSFLLKKGQYFFCNSSKFDSFDDTTLSTYLIFVKRPEGWVKAEESERHLIVNSIYGIPKNH